MMTNRFNPLSFRPRAKAGPAVAMVVALSLASALVSLAPRVHAAVPDQLTFQGVLMQENEPFTGTAHLVFTLFDATSGGSALWTQDYGDMEVVDGIYAAALGPFPGLAFDQTYWLEVSVDGSPLSPRYPLLSVPYAFRAAQAETAVSAQTATTADGVAAAAVDGAAVLDGSLTSADLGTNVVSSVAGVVNDGGGIDLIAGSNITITPDDDANTITIAAAGGSGGGDVTDVLGGAGLTATEPGGPQVTLAVGAGTGIEVTDDAVGLATDYASGAAYDSRFANEGDAGDVAEVSGGAGLIATNSGGPQVTLEIGVGAGLEASEDTLQLAAGYLSGAAYDAVFVNEGAPAGGDLIGTYPDPTVAKLRGREVAYVAPAQDDVLKWDGVWRPADDGVTLPFDGSVSGGPTGFAITNTDASNGTAIEGQGRTGIYGDSREDVPDGMHYGVYGTARDYGTGSPVGVCAQSEGRGSGVAEGLAAAGRAYGTGDAYGVTSVGWNDGSGIGYGIYGVGGGSGTCWAGYFSGNVNVTGTLSKGGGAFRIDHPLDPLNKYLQHSFVESPDMMNVYNGNIVTDERGYATVALPDWFEALNRDFRYQLTVIDAADGDAFAQAKIVRGIEGNAFILRTSVPRTEVSWQVTGIRHDPFADENRIQVEIDKTARERGKYAHPTAYGRPVEEGVNYRAPEELGMSRPARGQP